MQKVVLFVLFYIGCSQDSFGQKIDGDNLKIDVVSVDKQYPQTIDSLVIYNVTRDNIYKSIVDVSVANKQFKISCDPGIYKLLLKANGYKFSENIVTVYFIVQ